MGWIVAIDGGGSRTTACAADLAGRVLGFLEKGPANYHLIGADALAALLGGIIDELAAAHRLAKEELAVVSLGLAGVDRPGDRAVLDSLLAGLGLNCHFVVNNDAAVALAAGLGGARGVALIAGTGSIACGINGEGRVIRAGGWGHIVSDEGSGYAIGRMGIVRALKAAEGRDKASVLLARIMEYLQVTDLEGLIRFVYNQSTGKAAVAALARVVAEAAAGGDEVAGEILADAADELAALVESVLERGFPDDQAVPVCVWGGVINNIPAVRRRLEARLAGRATVVRPAGPPVLGALQLGYEYLGLKQVIKVDGH